MSDSLHNCLMRLRDDYARVQGEPFKHFFCPILWTDEDAELCMGHVVNKAFSNAWVVQRADVDSFFGSVAEAEFQGFLEINGKSLNDFIADPQLWKKGKPELTLDGEKVDYYVDAGGKVPQHYTRVQLEGKDGKVIHLIVKKGPDEVANAQPSFGVNKNCLSPAIASLIKAAHLTMFHMMGYHYALSTAGRYVGQILATFYLQNQGRSIGQIREAIKSYFKEFVKMVAPLYCASSSTNGTVADRKLHLFLGNGGQPFGTGVIVRMDDNIYTVLIPAVPGDADTMGTYLDFLRNANESVEVEVCRFNTDTGRCQYSGRGLPRRWLKGGTS